MSEGKLRKPRGTAFYLYNAIATQSFLFTSENLASPDLPLPLVSLFAPSILYHQTCHVQQCNVMKYTISTGIILILSSLNLLNIEKCSQNTSDSWTDTSTRRRWCRSCFYSPALVEAEGLASIFAAHREYHLELSLFFESLSLINIAAFCCCIASSEKTYKKYQ